MQHLGITIRLRRELNVVKVMSTLGQSVSRVAMSKNSLMSWLQEEPGKGMAPIQNLSRDCTCRPRMPSWKNDWNAWIYRSSIITHLQQGPLEWLAAQEPESADLETGRVHGLRGAAAGFAWSLSSGSLSWLRHVQCCSWRSPCRLVCGLSP